MFINIIYFLFIIDSRFVFIKEMCVEMNIVFKWKFLKVSMGFIIIFFFSVLRLYFRMKIIWKVVIVKLVLNMKKGRKSIFFLWEFIEILF